MFAGGNENIPICIRRRVVRRGELACELVGRIDERVIEVEEPWRSLVLRTCLQTLATGARNILKHAAALDDARHLDDVVLTVRSEQPELPVERCMVDPYVPAQPGFLRARNDLLERWIGYQESFQQAGLRRIGACEFKRGRGAVCFRISGVERHLRENLVGQPDYRVETAEREIAVDVGTGPQQIGSYDLSEVVAR